MLRIALLIALSCLGRVVCAASQQPGLLDGALAVVRVNDLLWCDRQVSGYAATANLDPQNHRNLLAEILFRSRSLAGIDLSRPALVAWRDQPASLLAVIPLSDRRAFLADFGADTRMGSPLIRFAEREGTTVYSQNTEHGLVEYRMLIQDETAYLATSVDECRALAASSYLAIGEGAPLEFSLRIKPGLVAQSLDAPWPFLVSPGIASLLRRYHTPLVTNVVEQISRIDLSIGPGKDGLIVVGGRLLARADAPLAQFLAVQKNLSSRLLPLVTTPNTAVACYGSILWQGELDRMGQNLAETANAVLGPAWTAQAEESWRRSWALRDRNGPFVGVIDLKCSASGIVPTTVLLTEQIQAGDLLVHAQRFAQAEDRHFVQKLLPGRRVASTSIADASIAGLPGWRHVFTVNDVPADYLQLATGRHVLTVESPLGTAEALAQEIVPRVLLDGGQKPEGTAAVLGGWIDIGVIARAIADDALATVPPARASFSVKASSQGDLVLQADIPITAIAAYERETRAQLARPSQ